MRFDSNRNACGSILPALLICLCAHARAQVNPDIYYLPDQAPFTPYAQIPLLLGNGFTATGSNLTVTLVGNDAGNTGYMYFVDPKTGQNRFLFSNKDPEGTTVDLGIFPEGAPVVFLYVADKTTLTPKKYTGANQVGTYDFDAIPALAGLFVNHKAMPVSPEINDKGDHRWAVSARVDCTRVVFGFEDVRNGDYDYNDIVFTVTGVHLDTESKLPSPVLAGKTAFRDSSVVSLAPGAGSPATARLFYTLDGTAPAVNAAGVPAGSTKEYLAPVTLAQDAVLKAIAWHANTVLDSCGRLQVFTSSDAVTGNYTRMPVLAAPTFTPPDGTMWVPGIAAVLSQAIGAEIHFVICDLKLPCADPDSSNPVYTVPLTLAHPALIKARAYKAGYVESAVASAQYALTLSVLAAAYLDRDGDGRIDAARIRLGAVPDRLPAEIALQDPIAKGAPLVVAADHLTADPGNLGVLLADFSDRPFVFGTGFAAGAYGSFPSGPEPYPAAAFTVLDSVGPVIVSADADPRQAGGPDGLRVVFSEDMRIELAGKAFPYSALHAGGREFAPSVTVSGGTLPDKRTVAYTLVAGTGPQPGDSLQSLAHMALGDDKGNRSGMAYHILIGGRIPITAQGGGFIRADPIPNAVPIANNVTLVVPADLPGGRAGECLDCSTGDWRRLDPARPAVFPKGPEITVRSKGGFAFDLTFFDHFGHIVNHAKGKVPDAMLQTAPVDSLGYKVAALRWYPVSESGNQAGTGVYIAVGTIFTESSVQTGTHGETIRMTGGSESLRVRMGYLR